MSLDAAAMASLLATFFEESFEGLDRTEAGLLALGGDASAEVVGDLFRAIHSIKGGAGAFGVDEVSALAHVMENLLDDVRNGTRPSPEMTAALLAGVDQLRRGLVGRQQGKPVHADELAPIVARLVASRSSAVAAPPEPDWRIAFAPHPAMMRTGNDPLAILRQLARLGGAVESVDVSRVPALADLDPAEIHLAWRLRVPGAVVRAELDDAFAWVEGECALTIEREVAHAAAAAAPPPPPPPAPELRKDAIGSLRVGVDKIDLLMNMVGELVITQSMLGELDDDRPLDAERVGRLREGLALLARTTRALQESVVRLRSTPVGVVFARLPRLVHDLGQRLHKDVAIAISGETTELDRTVIEKIGDPLVHIVRNSIDHGIENVATRLAAGKPAQGTIRVRAEHRGSAVAIEIIDDGRGLDLTKILAKAKERGLVPPDAQPRPDEIAQLIFAPGFSTADEVSEVSGRGVGMDVVWRHVKALRGDVSITSEPGRGTRTVLSLPLTLAIIDGQLVRLGDQAFVIPLLSIRETVELSQFQQRRLGACDVIRLRDEIVPIVDLAAVLGIRAPNQTPRRLLMIVDADGVPIGLLVDELLAQQQVVVKSLETNFGRVDGLAGGTILGDGRVAFILDVAALSRDVRRTGRTADPVGADHAA